MHGFVSHYTNKLDAKGRVSIPAPFRAVLARDGIDQLYSFTSPHGSAIDVGGNELQDEIAKHLKGLDPFTADHDLISFALYGDAEHLRMDGEGRVMLTPRIREVTNADAAVTFVGLGYKFQIWHPDAFEEQRKRALQRAFGMLATRATPPAPSGAS